MFDSRTLDRIKREEEQRRQALREKRGEQTEDVSKEKFVVFSENWLAWCVFQDCSNQWRMGFKGRFALDYNVVYRVMDSYGVRDELGTLRKVKYIEQGALLGFNGIKREDTGAF